MKKTATKILLCSGFLGTFGCSKPIKQVIPIIQEQEKTQIIENIKTESIEEIIENAQKQNKKKTLQQILKFDAKSKNFKRDAKINGVFVYQYNLNGIYGEILKIENKFDNNKFLATLVYSFNTNKSQDKQETCEIQLREIGKKDRGLYFDCQIDERSGKMKNIKLERGKNIDINNNKQVENFLIEHYSSFEQIKMWANKDTYQEIEWKYLEN